MPIYNTNTLIIRSPVVQIDGDGDDKRDEGRPVADEVEPREHLDAAVQLWRWHRLLQLPA